jgi:hypothetical protein
MDIDKQSIQYRYTIGRYGDEANARRIAEMKNIPFAEYCAWFHRTATGIGECRDPRSLRGQELVDYTPPIAKKKNESWGDYRLRQYDYWEKHVSHNSDGVLIWTD